MIICGSARGNESNLKSGAYASLLPSNNVGLLIFLHENYIRMLMIVFYIDDY